MFLCIQMQLRFDGALGFPGGLIDPGEVIVDGLNRECSEEIGLDPKHFVTEDDLVFSAFTTKSQRWPRLEMHAFAKEVSAQDYLRIEQNVFNAKDFGDEVRIVPRLHQYSRALQRSPLSSLVDSGTDPSPALHTGRGRLPQREGRRPAPLLAELLCGEREAAVAVLGSVQGPHNFGRGGEGIHIVRNGLNTFVCQC